MVVKQTDIAQVQEDIQDFVFTLSINPCHAE